MRILMVTPLLPHPRAVNAGPLVMYSHLAMIAARHEVVLASLAGQDPAELEALDDLRASGIDVRAVFTSRSPLSRVKRRVQRAGYRLWRQWPERTLQFHEPRMQELLAALLAQSMFDLIDLHDNAMGSYHYDPRFPTLLTEHEVRPAAEEPHSDPRRTSWVRARLSETQRRRWRFYQPMVWRRFDRIQVFTWRDARAIGSMSPDLTGRVRVNPFGIDIPNAADPSREDSHLLVFVGGFWHLPNVDAVLWLGKEIMPLIRMRSPEVRLAIVGSHPPLEVHALAGDGVIVTGRVPAVEPYLERAAVVLAPMRLGGGMRLKVLQAMALGKAVVTTPVGAEGLDVTAQPPPLAIANHPEGIAQATLDLLVDETRRRALGQRARAFVAEHHSWPAYAQRLQAIYSELVDGAPEPGGAPGG